MIGFEDRLAAAVFDQLHGHAYINLVPGDGGWRLTRHEDAADPGTVIEGCASAAALEADWLAPQRAGITGRAARAELAVMGIEPWVSAKSEAAE